VFISNAALAVCDNPGFSVTTSALNANTTVSFLLSAAGNFEVNWGDGTTDTITRASTGSADTYSHTYTTSGKRTIGFCGVATAYHIPGNADKPPVTDSTISFSTASKAKIVSVTGSLGAVFPTLNGGAADTDQPRFYKTFQECTSLTSIPAGLFTGVTGSVSNMFRETFDRCSGLTTIPDGLFSGASGGAPNMFRSTFYNCSKISNIPENLFAGITVGATNEFKYTFYGTTGLTGKFIPPSAFAGLIGITPRPTATDMWMQTFDSSGLVTACPERTKQYTTGYEPVWNGKVSCEPSNACTGTNYYDPENANADEDGCAPCPTGYTYDTSDTKEAVTFCKIQCTAGTYIASAGDTTCTNVGDGYYAATSVVAYGSTSGRTRCPDNMPTNTQTAASVDSCVVYCRGTNYRDASTNTCVACPDGYTYNTDDGKTAQSQCQIHCAGGYYLPIAGAATCTEVGDGYYATESTVGYGSTAPRTQCTDGRNTGTMTATSADQCQEMCTGATYYDGTRDMCVDCPIGYDYHTLSGKTSINQCQIHCPAGTYLATANARVCTNVGDGHYAAASNVNYGSIGTRGDCPSGQTTGTQTATSVLQCKTSCQGATYYDSNEGDCVACPTGYTDNTTNGKNSINQCQKHCAAGTYMETYIPVEYLKGDGTSTFIDTGYEITGTSISGTIVVSPASTVSGSNSDVGNFFGNIYGPGGFSSNYKKGVFGVWIQGGAKGDKAKTAGPDNAFNANKTYTIDFSVAVQNDGKTKATINVNNGTSSTSADYTQANSPFNDTGNTFKIFTNGAVTIENGEIVLNNGDKLYSGRIYSLQLYEDGDLVFDLVPVRRNSDNELGLYNRVNNTFYGNSGMGTFTAPNTAAGDSYALCSAVGDGYYAAASDNNYGASGTRNRCPNNAVTNKNNASSIYECDGVELCTGATYPHMSTGVCTACPTGYSYNTQNGKESILQCQVYCDAGTYIATVGDATCTNVGNGYYADVSVVNYGDAGERTRCENGGATGTDTATSSEACLAPVGDCEGATYMDSGSCVACPTGYTYNTTAGKIAAIDCQILCPEGSYLATVNDTACTNVGAGYWGTGGAVNYGSTSTRNRCGTGLATIGYGHGADEAADCGRQLVLGGYTFYTRSARDTTPSLGFKTSDNLLFYLSVSDSDHTLSPLHLDSGVQQYTVYDDSLLYNERPQP